MKSAKARHIQRRKYRGDPMVPVQGHVVKAMIHHQGLTVSGLAKQLGERQQTLQAIVSGKTSKVRKSRLEKLAQALGVSVDWLSKPHTGEAVLEIKNFKVEARGTVINPERVKLRELLGRAEQALRRDLYRWYGQDGEVRYQSWGYGVLLAIRELASPIRWRDVAIASKESTQPKLERRRKKKARVTEKERTGLPDVMGATWVHQVIEPWLSGKAYLNAGVLSAFLEVVFRNPSRKPTAAADAIDEADMFRGLTEYERAYEEHRGAHRSG